MGKTNRISTTNYLTKNIMIKKPMNSGQSSARLAQFAQFGRKIVCVGRNYTDHIAELGNTTPVKPMLFMKPPSTYIKNGTAIEIPLGCKEVQNELKAKGHPWELAKCFDTSCPISDLISKETINDPHDLNLVCKVNGELRQNESTGKMIHRIPELISYISQYFTLEEGDVVLTGTPAGVGPVKDGDIIEGEISGIVHFKFPVVQRI